MTNQEKWIAYTSGLPSPENFIHWSWFYLIAASLQRRVWIGPEHQPCYPNMYMILVGPPGVGKGLTINQVLYFLKYHLLDTSNTNNNIVKTEQDKLQAETVIDSDISNAQKAESQGKGKGQEIFKPLLIPVCADAITYEALVQAVGNSLRRINYMDLTNGTPKMKVHSHSSLCFALPELSSLLRKRTNDTVNYLLGLYDCPIDYEYVTKSSGRDRVRRGCLNMIAGTTPAFMQSTFEDDLIGEGFSSRTFFIYAHKNRKNVMWLPPLTEQQEQYKKDILAHIKKLTQLYGQVIVEPETEEWIANWWDKYEGDKQNRNNQHLEMVPYYARKNIHVLKLAMAKHFSEDAEQDEYGSPKNSLSIETFKWAINFAEREEKNMHLAIALNGNSVQSKIGRKILDMLGTGRKTYVHLLTDIKPPTRKDLDEQIELLEMTQQIKTEQIPDEDLGTNVTYWRLT